MQISAPAETTTTFRSIVLQAARSGFDWDFWESSMRSCGEWWKWSDTGNCSFQEQKWNEFWLIFGDELEEKDIFPKTREFLRTKKPMIHSHMKCIWLYKIFKNEETKEQCTEDMYNKLFMNDKQKTLKQFCVNVEHYLLTH